VGREVQRATTTSIRRVGKSVLKVGEEFRERVLEIGRRWPVFDLIRCPKTPRKRGKETGYGCLHRVVIGAVVDETFVLSMLVDKVLSIPRELKTSKQAGEDQGNAAFAPEALEVLEREVGMFGPRDRKIARAIRIGTRCSCFRDASDNFVIMIGGIRKVLLRDVCNDSLEEFLNLTFLATGNK
jgi:hypothetical protein